MGAGQMKATRARSRAGARTTIDGYVADSDYPSSYHGAFDPAAIDATLEILGIAPPRPARGPFRLTDLGCGDGIGLLAMAAGHPEGTFTGIDAHTGHVAGGEAAIGESGLGNIEVLAGTFAEPPAGMADGSADYVTAQGVLAWVSPENRAHLVALAARLLKPGGVLVVGYNAMPGWQMMASYQRLVRAIGETIEGTPVARYEGARDLMQRLGLVDHGAAEFLGSLPKGLPRDYFPHEYLNAHWSPLWSGDVIEMFAAAGLGFAGQMSPERLRPDLTMRSVQRAALEEIEGDAAREVAADQMLGCWFRADIYIKGEPRRLSSREQARRRLARHWRAKTASDDHGWSAKTKAGTIRFDNEAAHAIMARLREGPAALTDIPGIGAADLLNTADALLIAELIRPCEAAAEDAPALAFNRWRAGREFEFNAVAGRHGAIQMERASRFPDIDEASAAIFGLDGLLP